MDPAAEALAGEPRKTTGAATDAPDAAAWLANPKTHDATPEPGSPQSFRALLIAIGKVLDQPACDPDCAALFNAVDNLFSPADLERRKELEP